ncbi:Nuclear pore complex protein Nup214, partial [Stegodyphus mimosarum]
MSKSVLYSEHAKVEQTHVEEAKANQTAVPVDHKQSIPLQINNAKSATEIMIEKKTPVTTKFTLPTAQTFSPPDSSSVLTEASDGTIYESITPPDSPSASEYSVIANNSGDTSKTTSDKNGQTINFILPLEKTSPLLMKSSVPNVCWDKVHISAHSMKELTLNKTTPSSVFSQPLSSVSSNTSVMAAVQSGISDTSKSKENIPSVQSKPVFGKPVAAPPSLLFSASSSIPSSDKIVEDTATATSKSALTTVLTSSLQNIMPRTTSSATSLSSDTKFAQGLSAFHVKDKSIGQSAATQKSILPNFFSSPAAESSKPEATVAQVFGSGSFFPTSGVKNSSFFSISNTKSNSFLTQGNTSKEQPSLQSKTDSSMLSLQGQKSSGTVFSETLAQTGSQILGSKESPGISVVNSAEETSNLKTETTQSVSMASAITSVSTESNITTSGTLGINYTAFPSSIVQTVAASSAAFPEKNNNSSAPLFSQPPITGGGISSTNPTTVIFSPVNSSIPSLLSQANSTSVLCQTSSLSSVNTLFAQTTSPTTIPEATSSAVTSVVSAAQPTFIQPITTSSSTAFELKSTTASPTVFTEAPSTTSGTQLFEKTTELASILTQTTMANTTFGNPDSTTTPSVFGQKAENAPSFFGQTAATQSSFFAKAADTTAFGQSPILQNSPFGQSTGSFTQGAGTFFSQPAGGQPPVFANTTSAASSGFSFGKSSFGQSAGSFGLAKAVFGQNTQTFGQPPSSQSSTFGQSSGSIFGQGSFFSGLGGKPSAENASKNVFGGATSGKTSTDNNLFGNAGASTFGAKTGGSFTGSFSSGGGSVAQSGFGAFQQSPQKTGGFGSPPAFGSAPAFGGTAAFGSPPAFGSSAPLSGSVFGGGQQAANFSNFASASSPTFGSLASQNPGFGSPQQQPSFGQQSSPFGGMSVFGGTPSF